MLTVLGGLALFLLGIERISGALTAATGTHLRRVMASATSHPLKALGVGTLVSAATQSGTATAVTTLGLVASGLVAVREGIALSLGAKVGATLAVQVAAFDVGSAAIPLIGIGFLLRAWKRMRIGSDLLLGAGLLFFGLGVAVQAMDGAASSDLLRLALDAAERQPFAVLLVGTVVGAALSSANGAAAIALGLHLSGAASLETAVALVAGGNVGGTLLAVLAARDLDVAARRVAASHLALKAIFAAALVAAAAPAASFVASWGGDAGRQVANAHTAFNVVAALLGTLLAGPTAAAAARILPRMDDDAAPKYLREEALDDPLLALAAAERETVRISDHVASMTDRAVTALRTGSWDVGSIGFRESKVDRLTGAVVDFLAEARRRHGDEPRIARTLLMASELEHVGDQVRRLMRRDERMRQDGIEFSVEGRRELAEAGARVATRMRAAFDAIATHDPQVTLRVLEGRRLTESNDAHLRVTHLSRLENHLAASRASSSHHLEILTTLRQIDASITRIAGWADPSQQEPAPTVHLPTSGDAAPEGQIP